MALVNVRGLSDEHGGEIERAGIMLTTPEYLQALEALAQAVETEREGFSALGFPRIDAAFDALQDFPDWRDSPVVTP